MTTTRTSTPARGGQKAVDDDPNRHENRRRKGFVVPFVALVLAAPRDVPQFVLDASGPLGAVRAAVFSHDSRRLYSAGQDKAVGVWALDVDPERPERIILARSLRWEIARGPRGSIQALAASPVDSRLALAGYGARDATGDIILYDTARAQVLSALRGQRQTIVGLAFSPQADRLASADIRGELRIWSGPDWQSRVLRPAGTADMSPSPITFIGQNTLAAAGRSADGTVRIHYFDLARPDEAPRVLDPPLDGGIAALTHERDGERWASADLAGNVHVWTGATPRLLRKGRVATGLAFAPGERLFVATALFQYPEGSKQSAVEMWDLAAGQLVDQVETSRTDHNFVCSVSPDGRRLVTTGEDASRLHVYSLLDAQGQPRVRPLSQGPRATLAGRGRKPWKVAFAAGEAPRIGIGTRLHERPQFNDYAPIDLAFDLANPSIVDLARPPGNALTWRSPTEARGDWSFHRHPDGGRIDLLRGGQPWSTITLDPSSHGRCRCVCWIAGPDGEPFALAVGTDTQNGIFVFGRGERGRRCPLIRYYRDHADFVTSLSVSGDGRFLASASADHTVKVWSLEGLREAGPAFSLRGAWGATFEKRDDKVVVTSVIEAGTAGRKGLRKGDVVARAGFSRRPAGDGPFETTVADEILAGLESMSLTESVALTIERLGRPLNELVLLVPAWTPLLTLFIDERGEWALWTPQGFYEASVEGDSLFGWQLNRGVDQRPDVFRAEQFRDHLERPQVIRRLLSAGSLPEALRQTGVTLLPRSIEPLASQIRQTPIITIAEPAEGQELSAAGIRVVAHVDFPEESLAEQGSVRAYVNGVPGPQPAVSVDGLRRTYRWEMVPPDVFNRVRIATAGTQPVGSSESVHFRARGSFPRPRMHVLALAAADYPGDLRLEYPVVDATGVLEVLDRQGGRFYDPGLRQRLFGRDITPAAVRRVVAEVCDRLGSASPSDLVVVFIAGHGFGFEREYFFATPSVNLPPQAELARMPQAEQERIVRAELERTGIAWTELRRLASLPCRKLFLLDTCFAGNVLLAESPTALKAAIRPLRQDEILVLSATSLNQLAFEDPQAGHGVFTRFLLQGLGGAADHRRDGGVELSELVQYLQTEVPRFARGFGLDQTPTNSPAALLELISVPLVGY